MRRVMTSRNLYARSKFEGSVKKRAMFANCFSKYQWTCTKVLGKTHTWPVDGFSFI